MVGTVIAPSLSGILQHKNIGFSPSWLITLPSLGVVLFAPIIGRLLPKLGTLKLLSLGLIPYAVLGLLGAFITNDYVLMLDRILLGAATVAFKVLLKLNKRCTLHKSSLIRRPPIDLVFFFFL